MEWEDGAGSGKEKRQENDEAKKHNTPGLSCLSQGEIDTMERSQFRCEWKYSCRRSKRERWKKAASSASVLLPEMIATGCIITLLDQKTPVCY